MWAQRMEAQSAEKKLDDMENMEYFDYTQRSKQTKIAIKLKC